jgi:hypothetical protein
MKLDAKVLATAVERATEKLANEVDHVNGFKVVEARDKAGATHKIRVEIVMPELRVKILMRYATTEDARDLVRCFVPKEFGSDAFLDSLQPGSLAELANVTVGLLLGPKAVQRAMRGEKII